MRTAFLVLLLWAVACAHPGTASEDYINKLGNLLGGGDGRHPSASAERGDNTLAGDLQGGNAVGEELAERGGEDKGGRVGQAQHLNRVDHEDTSAWDGNGLGFLEEDARDADDGDNGEHYGTGDIGLPSRTGGLLDEEDDSGDDTFDENGEEEGGEGPTYVAGAVGGHGDSSSSSSSESVGADHRRYRNYLGSRYERTYRSPEVEDADVGEDSPSTEENSQLEEPVTSQSEENSASRSGEDRDGEDSPSMEGEGSKSREETADRLDEDLGESPEDISQEAVGTSSERSSRWSQEGQEDRESAEDRSVPSTPDSESWEDMGDQSKSREDDGDQIQSTEDTVEESKEDKNDSGPDRDMLSTSAESQSASPEEDGSQEDNADEDSRSTESNSESQEDDDNDDEESHSQEDATRESSSRGDDSSPQSLESGSRRRRLGAYHKKPAADYDDNDCQDGY
nr:PREDICTED: dentin matrix acidic phosphoprotein 1 [Opisthocomus hoazin]